jgi:TRAP-type uncharacterized transport system fused permease subunit
VLEIHHARFSRAVHVRARPERHRASPDRVVQDPRRRDWGSIALVTFTAAVGIVALAGGLQGWLFKRTTLAERIMLSVVGFLPVYPKALFDAVGFALGALVLVLQWLRRAPTRTS